MEGGRADQALRLSFAASASICGQDHSVPLDSSAWPPLHESRAAGFRRQSVLGTDLERVGVWLSWLSFPFCALRAHLRTTSHLWLLSVGRVRLPVVNSVITSFQFFPSFRIAPFIQSFQGAPMNSEFEKAARRPSDPGHTDAHTMVRPLPPLTSRQPSRLSHSRTVTPIPEPSSAFLRSLMTQLWVCSLNQPGRHA